MIVRRGDIFFADLSPVVGSEQGGIRPVLIVQNDIGNKYSPTVICAAITSQMNKAKLPTHIALSSAVYALPKDCLNKKPRIGQNSFPRFFLLSILFTYQNQPQEIQQDKDHCKCNNLSEADCHARNQHKSMIKHTAQAA